MTIKFNDSDYWPNFDITPESMAEVAELLRFSVNVKKQKAIIYLDFSDDQPKLTIQFQKVTIDSQITSISK